MSIATITTREQAVDFLEGYSSARKDELAEGRLASGLVKSYMLETVPDGSPQPDLEKSFAQANARVVPIDDTLWKVWANDFAREQDGITKQRRVGKWIGFIEQIIPRHPVFYTTERTQQSDPWVRRLVQANQSLDHVWLSGVAFHQLWLRVVDLNDPNRFGKIAFEYDSIFDVDRDIPQAEKHGAGEIDEDERELAEDLDDSIASDWVSEDKGYPERRTSRFVMVDRLGKMRDALERMQPIYDPLQSIAMLRIPSLGRSGHDFYANGKVTNRSDSFVEHRAYVQHVLGFYQRATEQTEQTAWVKVEERTDLAPRPILGAPVLIRFMDARNEPVSLDQRVFDRWIETTFGRKNNRFRLWGHPIRLGPGKVHVYGADRHLWQPIFLEITRKHILAILPQGTCGNTIHRLVTNVQRYICPNVSVRIGDISFSELIGRAARGATFK